MRIMADSNDDFEVIAAESGCVIEQLQTPLTRRKLQPGWFACDNGAFSPSFTLAGFLSMLKRHADHKRRCRFVAVPDIVGNARRTLEAFDFWRSKDQMRGWPLALVAQNGLEDMTIPWQHMAAVFIGGDTRWKCGDHARVIIKTAQAVGCWVHVGRVNTPDRFDYFEGLGVDSIDGTGLARYSHMREKVANRASKTGLFAEEPTNPNDLQP